MHRNKPKISFVNSIIILLVLISAYLGYTNYNDEFTNILHGDGLPAYDSISIQTFFCQQDNCSSILEQEILQANNVSCAFYDLDLENIKFALQEKEARVVIDNDHATELNGFNISVKTDWNSKYMHNKFCIFDNTRILTGSMNPTNNGAFKNDNNMIIIDSKILAKNYQTEFDEMFIDNDYHNKKGPVVLEPIIIDKEKKITLENYFCPEDNCQENVISILKNANESIYFMLFSFTSDEIGDILVKKSSSIHLEGILEKTQNVNSKYSEYDKLQENNISVLLDKNSFNMHHKVFIIDRKIVITGSYNPTNNGNAFNDENVLIIRDAKTAQLFLQEFKRIKATIEE